MPEPVLYEKPSGGFDITARTRDHTVELFVNHCEEQGAAEALATKQTPAVLGGLVRKRVAARREGPAAWAVVVEYSVGDASEAIGAPVPDPLEVGDGDSLGPEWSLETTPQTAHVTQAKGTRYRRVAADNPQGEGFVGSAPNESKAIGLTKDRVEGCDIYAPSLTFGVTTTRDAVNLAYINGALYGLVGKTNKEPFYVFDAGEVLYLGCTGTYTQDKRWRLTHKFAASPNERNLRFGDGPTNEVITIPFKGGWEYVWVSYRFKEVGFGDESIMMQVPQAVYVQRVYDAGDFNVLGLGGARNEAGKIVQRRAAKGNWVADLGVLRGNGIVFFPDGESPFGGGGDF